MASSGRIPRAILFAAVGAAIVGGTLPAVLKQATPAEDTTDRAALLAQAANDSVTAPTAEPVFMPSPVKVALVNTIPNAPARAGATASPPPAPTPQAQTPPAAPVTPVAAAPAPPSFPPVQPMDMDTADRAVAPVLRTLPPPTARTTAVTAAPPATTTVAAIAPTPETQADTAVAPTLDAPTTTVMAPAPDAPNITIIATPPAATKHVRRARVGHHRSARRRYVRPAPFSIRRLFATLRLR